MTKQPDLFGAAARRDLRHAPLAERMRPADLDEFVGQEKIVGPDRLLRRAIESDHLPSMLLWGPPGCGKTALAAVIAQRTGARFEPFSAVLGGVKDLRVIFAEAERQRDMHSRRTVLFVDEIHRLNKAQQDVLLPHVERGTVILVGATTENPSFEVNAALLSRCRVFVLEPLEEEQIGQLVDRALSDEKRGLGKQKLSLNAEARKLLIEAARGDARRALNTLEAAAEHVGEGGHIEREAVEEAVQHKALLYDRAGDEHYNVVSAFIKSLRGSDPDAAVYWMTRMLEAGENPRFILRRMVIFASEDVGNADPQALQLAAATLQAHEFVGLPESALCLSQLACYLASAPKSNTALVAYAQARKDVRELGNLPVPKHLLNAPTDLMSKLGHGKNYKYPHDFAGSYVVEDYLPEKLRGRRYYEPKGQGAEAAIKARLHAWRGGQEEEEEE